ncbi:GGDEF domain-containing protein [Catenuloplanes japonicus]|uniref:GGDEF domain-containing protein n=1 Tax=Catenuloplanes japonicus TaxID=33876 RepID=UPI00068A4510|nr:GGDEF domain-containing protein [Catenuloplanes japonicus]
MQTFVTITAEHLTDLMSTIKRLTGEANTDELTGLPNRRSLLTELHRLERINKPFSLLIFDLNGFKKLNDTHGHRAGDNALRHVARHLHTAVHIFMNDLFPARLGGDEFAVIIRGNAADGHAIAHIILTTLAEQESISASGGVTYRDHCRDLTDLMGRADRAMYIAKRDRHTVIPGIPPYITDRLHLTGPPNTGRRRFRDS